jgi:Cu(I)/Ag(I) efflux system membrane fusion protein
MPVQQDMKSGDTSADIPSADVTQEMQAIDIPIEKQQLIGVKTVTVAMVSLKKTIRTVGRVQFDEAKVTTVNLKVDGWIDKLNADFSGKYVTKGSPLATIYSPELYAAYLELSNLQVWKKDKSHRFQRNVEVKFGDRYGQTAQMLTFDLDAVLKVQHQRLKLWDVPDDVIKKIESGGEPPRTFVLLSPASGYVFQKPGVKGTRVSPGDKLFDIVDLSSVWIIADIYEYELSMVKTGLSGIITSNALPDEEIRAKIDYLYPSLSAQTRTAKVRFTVPNTKTLLKPQMFVNVEIPVDLGERLAIPESAVIDSGPRQVVYVAKEAGLFEPRVVKLGIRADRMVEVLKGLKAGERVAATGTFLIDSEARLKGIVQ